jgi:hypothetical protein
VSHGFSIGAEEKKMNRVHIGKSRSYMGWRIEDLYEEGPTGKKRSGWRASKNGVVVLFADTLAEVKDRIREEEYQYEE